MKPLLIILGILLLLVIFLPYILQLLGLHPSYTGEKYDLSKHRALIITTSHAELGPGGKPTGVYASEMTAPYYAFLDAYMTVDIASIRGGAIPIEPMSLKWPVKMKADKRFLSDPEFQEKVKLSQRIDQIDFTAYDIIFLAGGWGAAYDLGTSVVLGEKITQANARGIIIGGICHGPLGLLLAKDSSGAPLVRGRNLTAVTDKQVRELKITVTPQHPERELRSMGAHFHSRTAFRDFFANLTVVDGNLVTGQNQNAGEETASKMMELLHRKTR